MKEKIKFVFIIVAACHMVAIPEREPFGEQSYSGNEAQAVYEEVCAWVEQADFFEGERVQH